MILSDQGEIERSAMLEIELKFPVDDFHRIETQLKQWNATPLGAQDEADHYLNAPDRDFGQTDEALRLRRIGEKNFVTYKGPKIDKTTKTRTEIEIPLGDGDAVANDFIRIVTLLGYKPVAVVRKKRTMSRITRGGFSLDVCLDKVIEVGTFVELEILAPEEQLDAARSVLHDIAAELGLKNSERRSYLQMLLEAQKPST